MASYSDAVLADSPTVYWRLGETGGTIAEDSSGNSHTGTYANTPTLGVPPLIPGDFVDNAVAFAAANAESVVADDTLGTLGADLGNASFEFWFAGTSTAGGGGVAALCGSAGSPRFTAYPNTDEEFNEAIGSTAFEWVDADGATLVGSISHSIYDGAPHHVVIVATDLPNNAFSVYVDGDLQAVSVGSIAQGPSAFSGSFSSFALGGRGAEVLESVWSDDFTVPDAADYDHSSWVPGTFVGDGSGHLSADPADYGQMDPLGAYPVGVSVDVSAGAMAQIRFEAVAPTIYDLILGANDTEYSGTVFYAQLVVGTGVGGVGDAQLIVDDNSGSGIQVAGTLTAPTGWLVLKIDGTDAIGEVWDTDPALGGSPAITNTLSGVNPALAGDRAGFDVGSSGSGGAWLDDFQVYDQPELAEVSYEVLGHFSGTLDEFAAYPVRLSSDQVRAHYEAATWTPPVSSPQPTLSHTAQRLYDALEPLASEDPQNGWALAHYCGALAAKLDLIADLSRDQEDGTPGWAVLFDLDECPELFLPWLAQFIGVNIPAGLDDAQQRQRIRETAGFRRGTPDAIRGAARQYLTDTQTVFLIERQGGAYKLAVSTLASETPDSAKVEAALLEQKPAGLSLVYTLITGGTFDTLRGTHTDFTDVAGQFATFDDLRADPALT